MPSSPRVRPRMARALDVRLDRTEMDVRRQRREHLGVLAHQAEEVRSPRPQRDHVDETERRVRALRAAAAHAARPRRRSHAPRRAERSDPICCKRSANSSPCTPRSTAMLRIHRRLAVARHVPEVDRELAGQRLGVRRPQLRRPRRAMAEHQRRAGTEPIPRNPPAPPLVPARQLHHRCHPRPAELSEVGPRQEGAELLTTRRSVEG